MTTANGEGARMISELMIDDERKSEKSCILWIYNNQPWEVYLIIRIMWRWRG